MPASKVIVPHIRAPIAGPDGTASREWYRWADELTRTLNALSVGSGITTEDAVDAVAAAIAAGTHTNISIAYNDAGNSLSFTGSAGASYTDEQAVDAVAAALAAGTHTNVTVTYNDAGNSLSLASAAGYTDEQAQDAVAAAFAAGTHTDISVTYNDAGNSLSLAYTGGGAAIPEAVSLYAASDAWWEFEENDATALYLDAVNTNNLSVRTSGGASTTSATSSDTSGLMGRHFAPNAVEGTTVYLPSTYKKANAAFSFGGWFKNLASVGGSARFLMGDIGSTATDFQAYIYIESDDRLEARFTTTGALAGATIVGGTVAPSSADWMLIVATLDRAANQIILRTQKVGDASAVKETATFAGALYTGSSTSNWCINDGLSGGSTYFAGTRAGVNDCAQAFIIDSAMTDAEYEYLFNAGSLKTWADVTTDSGN